MPRGVDQRALLASISILQGLEDDDLEGLLGITHARDLGEGEVLFRKGDPGNQLYGVLEGSLRVSGEADDGEELTFGVLEAGEVFGEVALLDSSPRSATVTALGPTRLLSLHRDDFLPFLSKHPRVSVRLAAVLADRVRRLSALMEDMIFVTLPSRLSMNLLALARAAGGETPEGVSLDISLPSNQLDQIAGSTPEKIREQVREWEERGLVALDHGVITVRGLDGLESLARFLIV